MSRSEYDANKHLARMDIDAPINTSLNYELLEARQANDEPSLYSEGAQGAVLMACLIVSCSGLGFVIGRYF